MVFKYFIFIYICCIFIFIIFTLIDPSTNSLQQNKLNLKNKKLLKENQEKGNKQESKVLSKRKRALLKLKKISAAYNINTHHNWKNFIHNTNSVKDRSLSKQIICKKLISKNKC